MSCVADPLDRRNDDRPKNNVKHNQEVFETFRQTKGLPSEMLVLPAHWHLFLAIESIVSYRVVFIELLFAEALQIPVRLNSGVHLNKDVVLIGVVL